MTGVPMDTMTGPQTFTPAEFIAGGQVVEARANSRVGVAGAGSTKTLGIAVVDGVSPDAFVGTPTTGPDGRPVINAAPLPSVVPVAHSGIAVAGVKYVAAAAFGAKLKAAAAGAVTPMAPGDDCQLEVGTCWEPAGVILNGFGRVKTK